MEINKTEKFENWRQWKETLAKAVNLGESVGLSVETIDKIAYRIGTFLSATTDPENREQRLLQELWRAGDDSDRKALSRMIVKMVQTDTTH